MAAPDTRALYLEREAWQHILLSQAGQRPLWQPQDVYKLAYQAALGGEHAAPDEAAARRWLEQECAGLGAGPADLPLESISPDGRLVRVNLRPYLAVGGSPEALLQAFLRTAVTWQGQHDLLRQYITWTIALTTTGELDFQLPDAKIYFQHLAESGFPPAHHSTIYRELYLPAYRVVSLDLLPFHP